MPLGQTNLSWKLENLKTDRAKLIKSPCRSLEISTKHQMIVKIVRIIQPASPRTLKLKSPLHLSGEKFQMIDSHENNNLDDTNF